MAVKHTRFKIIRSEFEKFLNLISELNKLSEEHKFIWDEKGILIYTLMGDTQTQNINVLKTFYIRRDKLFSNLPSDINLVYSMFNSKLFVKKFSFILQSEDTEFEICFSHDDLNNVQLFEAKNSTLEMRFTADDTSGIKLLNIEKKKQIMDKDMATTTFNMSVEDLDKIRKISKIEPDSETITLTIENGNIRFGESQWELEVLTDIDSPDMVCFFKKHYLNAIVPGKDEVEISIFPTYILVDETKSQFLFCLELTA